MEGTGKRTRGRQKIVLKKITNNEDRLVTFSKRRSGIYKKVSELITMCGVEVGIVIFSPSGRSYSVGQPSIQSIIDKFLERTVDSSTDSRVQAIVDTHRRMRMEQQNDSHSDLVEQLGAEKDRAKSLKQITQATKQGISKNWELGWWEQPIDELTLPELAKVCLAMEAFHKDLCNYLNYHPKHPTVHLPDIRMTNREAAATE